MATHGTGLTSGFTELLANWDQVLQSLDRVSAYTAERANEAAVRLAGRDRPVLFGQTPEGTEWQNLKPPGGYPQKAVLPDWEAKQVTQRPERGAGNLQQLEKRLVREEQRHLLHCVFSLWKGLRRPEVPQVTKKEPARRPAHSTSTAVQWCYEAQLHGLILKVFHAWQRQLHYALKAQKSASEGQDEAILRREIAAEKAKREQAEAQWRAGSTALASAQEELSSMRIELAKSRAELRQAQLKVNEVQADVSSERQRQLVDLRIKLARCDSDPRELLNLLRGAEEAKVDKKRADSVASTPNIQSSLSLPSLSSVSSPSVRSRSKQSEEERKKWNAWPS